VAAEQTAHVLKVLAEIGAESTPQIMVLNKSDALPEAGRPQNPIARQNDTPAAYVSARSGDGLSALLQLIDQHLVEDPVARQRFRLPLGEGRALHLLHDRAAVVTMCYQDEYCEVVADAPQSIRNRLAEFAVPN
jgi:GTP-binding protein HflX